MRKEDLPVALNGVCEPFSSNGRKLGYPTANIHTDTTLKDGVYFGYADLSSYSHHPALIFIGTPTTVGDTDRRLESHLLDIEDKDYYGEKLELEIAHFYRPNKKFSSIEELKKVMRGDEQAGRKWFKEQR